MSLKSKNILWFVIALLSNIFFLIYLILPHLISYNEYFIFDDPDSPVAQATMSMNISHYLGEAYQLAYFTILTGLMYSFIFTLYTLPISRKFINDNIMTNFIMYEVIIMIVYWTMLAPFTQPKNMPINFTLDGIAHGVVPLIGITYYFFNIKSFRVMPLKKGLLYSLIYPMVYYIFTWIFYISIKGQACIYPFFDYYHPFSIDVKVIWDILIDIGIFIGMLGIFVGIYVLNNYLINKNRPIK